MNKEIDVTEEKIKEQKKFFHKCIVTYAYLFDLRVRRTKKNEENEVRKHYN